LVKSINTFPVFKTDKYELVMGKNPGVFDHRPDLQSDRKAADVLFIYTYIELDNGGTIFDYMTMSEIKAIKLRSKASSNGPWVTDEIEMQKKTCLRRALKRCPKSVEIRKALAFDNSNDSGERMIDVSFEDVIEGEVVPVVDTSSTRAKLQAPAENPPADITDPFPANNSDDWTASQAG
jgi:recombination protein RecT